MSYPAFSSPDDSQAPPSYEQFTAKPPQIPQNYPATNPNSTSDQPPAILQYPGIHNQQQQQQQQNHFLNYPGIQSQNNNPSNPFTNYPGLQQ
jgi:hypothetical protein